jgi:hypothetical protein
MNPYGTVHVPIHRWTFLQFLFLFLVLLRGCAYGLRPISVLSLSFLFFLIQFIFLFLFFVGKFLFLFFLMFFLLFSLYVVLVIHEYFFEPVTII